VQDQDQVEHRLNSSAGTIELHLSTIERLFNSFDPSPFHEKDLDAEAERYLVGRARELPNDSSLRLIVTVSKPVQNDVRTQHIPEAIHSHFHYRANQTRQDLRELIRTGWIALPIGLFVLTSCLLIIQYGGLVTSVSPISRIAEQSLLLLGWVANWRPIEIFLYDWWPIWRRLILFRRLAKMPVKIRIVPPHVPAKD
jgi:hypothetical protein